MMTSLMTPEERAMQAADETASAEGAGRLLAAMLVALDAANSAENLPAYVRNDVANQVAHLLSTTRGFAEKFERSL